MAGRKIDINKAGIEELSSLIGIGRAKATAILETRKVSGGFKTIKDLKNIPGIGPSILELNQGFLSCGKLIKDQSGCSSSEVYCLRGRGDPPTSSTVAKITPIDSYCLRDRGESSKQKVVPHKVEVPSSSHSHKQSRGGSSCESKSPSTASSNSDQDDDSEIQFLNANLQCEVFSDSDTDSSQDCGARLSPGDATDMSSGDVGNTSDGESIDSGDVYSLVEDKKDSGVVGSLRSRSAQTSTDKSVMKRKSEGGGSKDGSPEKKPCRTSGEGAKSEEQPSSSKSSSSNNNKSSEKSTHPFLRKGRIPSKANPPPELANWLKTFVKWSHAERLMALDELMELCEPTQVRHVMQVIEPQFQRDFISLLPKELALYVLSFLGPLDLCRAAQTCQYWRVLAEDNLMWRDKCLEENIDERFVSETRTRGGRLYSTCKSPHKAAFMRQQRIESNWREGKIKPPKVLKGHDDHVITCLEFSASKVVSGSDDNTLKVWSAITGKCLRTLVGHTGGVWSSQMRDNVIISGSTDRTLRVWNADTGQCVHTLYGHTSTVRCMCLYENKVVSGSRDATLRVWDVETGQFLHVLMGHVAAVRCVQFDGKRVVSGAYDYMVKIWDPDTETCVHTLSGHTNRVYSLQFDGTHIVSGSLDTSIRVWEVETGQCLHTLVGHQSLTSGMELKDNILVSGNADSTVKVWDIKTGLCLQTLQGVFKHQSAVTCLQFNKKFVITSSDDGTVKMWSLRTGCFLRNLVSLDSGGSGGVVWRIRASNTKLVCAVGSRNGTEETKLLVLDFDIEDCETQQNKISNTTTGSPPAGT